MITANFQKAIYEKDNFSICSFTPKNPNEVPASALSPFGTFTGVGTNIPHNGDIELNLDGDWENSKYGMQFKVVGCISVLPRTEEGIIAFLSSGVLPYIKNKMAVRIYAQFGNDCFSVLENEPERWLTVKGITQKKLEAIKDAYTINYGYQDLMMLLSPTGVSVSKIKKIVDKFGATATEKVKNNPYVLFDINGFGFKTVDDIARKTKTPLNDSLRIKGALKFVLEDEQSNGNLCIKQETLRQKAYDMLNEGFEPQVVSLMEITDAIIDMAKQGTLRGDNGFAYLPYNYENEKFSALKIAEMLKSKYRPVNVQKEIEAFELENFKLAEKQKDAIQMFFSNRFSVITGGPGTGKSTVLKAILTIQARLFPKSEAMLLAPTGKAARRMAEATGKKATTIHSGLGISEDTTLSDIQCVDADVVIVDEASMCDQKLFALLAAAIDTKKTKLLLVGDSDQLPSVGAGNVLHELISCGKVPITRLNLVYRQGKDSIIPKNSDKINKGIAKLEFTNDFRFLTAEEPNDCFNTVIDAYISEVERLGIENVCVLCPMKSRGLNCVNEYNKKIQEVVNPIDKSKPEIHFKNRVFRLGDKVMQTKNSDGISNGETGFITAIHKDEDDNETCLIQFESKEKPSLYCMEDMQNIVLAYATTIHKSQGSEYKSVIIPLLKSYYIMLKRNLIYTAVTRAKERVTMVGQKSAIYLGVKNLETTQRQTQLGNRICTFLEA